MKCILALILVFSSMLNAEQLSRAEFVALALSRNPQIRACRFTQGLFRVIETSADQIGFCVYEKSLIDAVSVMQILESKQTLAVQAFLETENIEHATCASAGAKALHGQMDNSGVHSDSPVHYKICQFTDNSYLELRTLKLGVNARENKKLAELISH